MEKNKGGRPLKYKTVEKLEEAIDEYFKNCPDTKIIFFKTKDGVIEKEVPCPTVTGLAIHLGFESRQSFYDYEGNPKFSYTMKKARLFIEREYEKQLSTNPVGAIFALKNLGWKDKTEQNINVNGFAEWLKTLDE